MSSCIYVIDASVAAKWIISEPESAIANELLSSGASFAAPSVIRHEVAGAALRRYRAGTMTEVVARQACATWEAMLDDTMMKLVPVDDIFDEALNLGFQLKHALIDCFYLAIAMRLSCPLLTADQTFYERAKRAYEPIQLLEKVA